MEILSSFCVVSEAYMSYIVEGISYIIVISDKKNLMLLQYIIIQWASEFENFKSCIV